MPAEQFPWFADARLKDIFAVTVDGDHLRWESLDVDLDLDCLEHPERYPLVFR